MERWKWQIYKMKEKNSWKDEEMERWRTKRRWNLRRGERETEKR